MTTERKHISLIDPEGKTMKVYAGIPTIIPSGTYIFKETIGPDFIICGEIDKDIIWSFKERRFIVGE